MGRASRAAPPRLPSPAGRVDDADEEGGVSRRDTAVEILVEGGEDRGRLGSATGELSILSSDGKKEEVR